MTNISKTCLTKVVCKKCTHVHVYSCVLPGGSETRALSNTCELAASMPLNKVNKCQILHPNISERLTSRQLCSLPENTLICTHTRNYTSFFKLMCLPDIRLTDYLNICFLIMKL